MNWMNEWRKLVTRAAVEQVESEARWPQGEDIVSVHFSVSANISDYLIDKKKDNTKCQ